MLFHVKMDVNLPVDMPEQQAAEIKLKEKNLAQELQKQGIWRHLWRVVGEYSNISIFDVDSSEQLHNTLQSLPLYPYMNISVMALCRHPSSIKEGDL